MMNIRLPLLLVCGIVLSSSLEACQRRFEADVRQSAADSVKEVSICALREERAVDCVILHESDGRLSELLSALTGARAILPPGKVPITKERILKIRTSDSPPGRFTNCYRLIEFDGFPDEYVNQVEMNEGCIQLISYQSGYVITRRIE
jgi:hypothetical protein